MYSHFCGVSLLGAEQMWQDPPHYCGGFLLGWYTFLVHDHSRRIWKTLFYTITLGAASAAVVYEGYQIHRQFNVLNTNLLTEKQNVSDLDSLLSQAEYEKSELSDALYATQTKLTQFEADITDLSKRVGTYQKLETLDPELLQKYSKVYFLNENYVPSSLATIDTAYVSGKGKVLQFHGDGWPFLKEMLDDANAAGLGLRVASAYRSFKTQATLKSTNVVQYGSGANKFSADQGYSEHQLGTTLDLTTVKTGDLSARFELSPEFLWLRDNAHRYGFTLSYPKNNKYYIYEPWHWRFVGRALATELYDHGQHLYDLEQREIDGYLLGIFDRDM